MKKLILVFILISSLSLKAQNLISNPDFSEVEIYYNNGKNVYPTDWKFFHHSIFFHQAQIEDENFRTGLHQRSQGFILIQILVDGATTKLKNSLEARKSYDIKIELKIDLCMVNSILKGKGKGYFMDGTPMDSADYDYNYPVSLVTYFSAKEPSKEMKERSFVIFDLPEGVSQNLPRWYEFHQIYNAKGDEEYFSIGTFSGEDYVDILRTVKNDTADYHHKFAQYFIRNVSIFPINDSIASIKDNNAQIKIVDRFEPNSILMATPDHKIIVRRVNFKLSSFELGDSAKQEINKIALFMKEKPKFNLNITGHTDSIGTKPHNQILSEKRAEAVCQYLVCLGIEKSRLTSAGKGEEKPLDEKLLKKNFGLNRRVEFEFTAGQQ
jgi:outer membrane protein OmpA-like peptidoglycan-associated protein